MHLHNPLHRIRQWTGKYFIPSWLWKVGLCINLGHGGDPCPCYREGDVFAESFSSHIPDKEEEFEDHSGVDAGRPTSAGIPGARIMVIVHTNGIHYLPIRICRCEGGPTEDIQMLRLGYYPSTYKYIRTMFTFQVLDDYLLANSECQTSGHHYYLKLRRMTNKATPHLVPVSFNGSLRFKCQRGVIRTDIGSCSGLVDSGGILRNGSGSALGIGNKGPDLRNLLYFIQLVPSPALTCQLTGKMILFSGCIGEVLL